MTATASAALMRPRRAGPDVPADLPATATGETRHGRLTWFAEDRYVGRSLKEYGEYSEGETALFRQFLREGSVVIEAGANIGALTVPLARIVGETGRVFAFEPQPENRALLTRNVIDNGLGQITIAPFALGAARGMIRMPALAAVTHHNFGRVETAAEGRHPVAVETIDALGIGRCDLIKIDVEGDELKVLQGAAETLKRCRPFLYVENDREANSPGVVAFLVDAGYRLYWHRPPLFSPDNFAGNGENVFGPVVSLNVLCVPEEKRIRVRDLDEIVDLRPDDAIYDRIVARYERFVQSDPPDLGARVIAAMYHGLMQRTQEAEALLAENLARDPDHLPSRAIRGLLNLQRGDYETGWPDYELRYQFAKMALFGNRPHAGAPWSGQPTDRPVLVWCEQGFGDSIMFGRFIAEAHRRAPNLIVEIQPQLYELFEHSGIPGRLVRKGRALPEESYHCSIPSLPAVLGVGSDIESPPYLFPEPGLARGWRDHWHPRIGICRSGSPRSERPWSRDIPASFLEPLCETYGALALDQVGQFESFMDSAGAIASLDLVITVDTAVAHLAGAMGKEVWLLLSFDPDWRWGISGQTTRWYQSMRIFRQKKMWDWGSVMTEVMAALAGRSPQKGE